MLKISILVFLFIPFLKVVNGVEKAKYIHPIGGDEYKILKELTLGTYNKPVKERSTIEKNTIIRFWRAKGKFTVEAGKLYYDGKKVDICSR